MARKQRLLCSTCKHVWRIEIGYYEESDHVIHGCKKPRKAKFAGSAIRQFRGCLDYEDIAGITCKPCPFCGSSELRIPFEGSGYFVECKKCGCTGPDDHAAQEPEPDEKAAIRAWNQRDNNRISEQAEDYRG